jgi:hypothetical protein
MCGDQFWVAILHLFAADPEWELLASSRLTAGDPR